MIKNTFLLLFVSMFFFTTNSFAQRVIYDSLTANAGSNKSIMWTPSTYQNGYGHKIYGIDGGVKTDLRFASRHNIATWTDIMTITSNGNVGIGTVNPADRLEIAGSLGSMKFSNSGARIIFTRNSGNYIDAASSGGSLIFSTGGSLERMRIDSNGNVGIGTTSPAAKLNINGGSYTNDLTQFVTNSTLRIDVANPAISLGVGYSSTDNPTLQAFNNVSKVANSLLINPYGGNVVIGAIDAKGYKLAVAGSMIAERVKVKVQTGWPDYVFQPEYALPSLGEVERFIKANKHLPGVPTAEEVEKEGLDIGEMNKRLLEKVEEMTLYLISQQKQIDQLRQQNELLSKDLHEYKIKL